MYRTRRKRNALERINKDDFSLPQPQRPQQSEPPTERYASERAPRQGALAEHTYGDVLTRVWGNNDRSGGVYFTVSQHRIYQQGVEVRVAKSFRAENCEDVLRGMQWAMSVLAKLEDVQGGEPTPSRQPTKRTARRTGVTKLNQRRGDRA